MGQMHQVLLNCVVNQPLVKPASLYSNCIM